LLFHPVHKLPLLESHISLISPTDGHHSALRIGVHRFDRNLQKCRHFFSRHQFDGICCARRAFICFAHWAFLNVGLRVHACLVYSWLGIAFFKILLSWLLVPRPRWSGGRGCREIPKDFEKCSRGLSERVVIPRQIKTYCLAAG